MSTQKLTIDCGDLSKAGFQSVCDLSPGQLPALQNIENFLGGISGGNFSAVITCDVGVVKASGSFAFASVIATDVLAINGVSFTCVPSAPTANQFVVGINDTATAVNAAAAINASVSALVADSAGVVAVASGTSVLITARSGGASGNAITITTPDSTITPSGARLTGGSDGTVSILNFL